MRIVKNNENENVIIYIGFVVMAFVLMFYYTMDPYGSIAIGLIGVLICAKKRVKVFLTNGDYFWLIYILIMFGIGVFRSVNQIVLIKRTVFLLLLVLLKITIQCFNTKSYYKLGNLLVPFGFIHVVSIFAEYINPIMVKNIRNTLGIESIFDADRIDVVYRGGITPQPGVAGFVISIFLAICFIRVLKSYGKNKFFYIIMFLFGYVALILTGKRTFLIAILVSSIVSIFIYYVVLQRKSFKIVGVILFFIIVVPIIARNGLIALTIERVLYGGLSGRELVYSFLIQNFLSSPIIGVGAEAFSNVMDLGAHNEYLRVLSENGLLGFSFFFLALISTLTYTLAALKHYRVHITQEKFANDDSRVFVLLLSIYWQVFILIYSLTGNPLNTIEQQLSYFSFSAFGVCAAREITRSDQFIE